MSLTGRFEKYMHFSPKHNVYLPDWSFILTNTSRFDNKKIIAYITDYWGSKKSNPMNVEVRGGNSYTFNMDNTHWLWGQGDVFYVLDADSGETLGRWEFWVKVYAPGECPDCHGAKTCPSCRGERIIMTETRYKLGFLHCPRCCGTGECQTCYVPYHEDSLGTKRIPDRLPPQNIPKRTKPKFMIRMEIDKKKNLLATIEKKLNQAAYQGKINSSEYNILKTSRENLKNQINVLEMQLNL